MKTENLKKENLKKENSLRAFFTHVFHIILNFLITQWKAAVTVIFASCLQAFAVNYFTLHYRFPDLGVSGIAVLSNYMFGISPNWVILTGNILLLIWAHKYLNLKFFVLTAISIITFSTI